MEHPPLIFINSNMFFLGKSKLKYLHTLPDIFLITLASFLAFLILYCHLSTDGRAAGALRVSDDVCGRRIHVLELPPKFNYVMLDQCRTISKKKNMCVYIENHGFGPRIFSKSTREDTDGGFEAGSRSWYDTDKFTLELIFHTRMKKYDCLTSTVSLVDAIYIPFYADMEVSRILRLRNTAERDQIVKEVMMYISSLLGWRIWEGRDHFFVAGWIGRDFIRPINYSYLEIHLCANRNPSISSLDFIPF